MENNNKIFIAVDDEILMKDIFKLHFRHELRSGMFDFQFFERASDCLDFIAQNENHVKVILLLTDINMPEMNGLNLLNMIKTKYPHIKVFMSSAHDSQDYLAKAQIIGAD